MAIENDILDLASSMNCQELHVVSDNKTNLKAIVAIHNTNRGPTLGGCRWVEYDSTYDAAYDAIRLAEGMSYKSAVSNLPLGGGKSVILKPKGVVVDKEAYFRAFGKFINDLNGRYITAVDSGTSPTEMDIIAQETTFVSNTTKVKYSNANPSPMTCIGVFYGIKAAVKYKLKETDLSKITVAIQGVGNTGYGIAKLLHEQGAKLYVYDVNKKAVEQCVAEFGAKAVDNPNDIYKVDADVFCPCALGATVNSETIEMLKAPIIAGAANNQLKEPESDARKIKERDILYAPDFVINAGGIIYVAGEHTNKTEEQAIKEIKGIYDTLIEIFERSKREDKTSYSIAYDIAKEKLEAK